MRRFVLPGLLVLFLGAAASLSSCDGTTNPDTDIVFPDSGVSYIRHVQPFFTLRCAVGGCHDDQSRASNLSLTTYINTTARPGIVVPGNSGASLLMQRIDGRLPHPINVPIMVNAAQLKGIRTWIDEGARNN